MHRVFLFDLDGTLIDSAEDIALCLRLTLEDIGMEDRMPEDVKSLIGGGIRALLERVLGEDFREDHVRIFRGHYLDNPVVHTKLYPGVEEVLRTLKKKGKATAVVSNKLEELSREILKRLGVLDLFDLVVGGDTFEEKKPSPVPVRKTLDLIGCDPDEAVMIGDTEADIVAGKGAGTKTALALWGYVKVNSERPDYTLKTPKDILSLA
ncbi:MAG: HAD-IA family hydrolase [Aquificota bacterium]|nr:HAD-IA family hydrolase [Aquificota bacterium]